MNGCLATCEECGNDFIPEHDETLCRECTWEKEEEKAWLARGLPKYGAARRDAWIDGYQAGREEA